METLKWVAQADHYARSIAPPTPMLTDPESDELKQLRSVARELTSRIDKLKETDTDTHRKLAAYVLRRSDILKRIGQLTVGQLHTA